MLESYLGHQDASASLLTQFVAQQDVIRKNPNSCLDITN